MSKHSNAPTRRRGKALPRHGRRVKAGCVKHRNPLSIILTASWPRSMSVFCSMCSCESPSFLTIGLDLLYCKNMICFYARENQRVMRNSVLLCETIARPFICFIIIVIFLIPMPVVLNRELLSAIWFVISIPASLLR